MSGTTIIARISMSLNAEQLLDTTFWLKPWQRSQLFPQEVELAINLLYSVCYRVN